VPVSRVEELQSNSGASLTQLWPPGKSKTARTKIIIPLTLSITLIVLQN
jgi:hypothetical protein